MLREKRPNTELFWSVFSHIQSEYGKIRTRKNSVFGHFSQSDSCLETSNNNTIRCLKEGLMEPLSRTQNRGTMVKSGSHGSYKRSRTECCKVRHMGLLRSSARFSKLSFTLGIGLERVEIRSSNCPINLQNSLDSRYRPPSFEGVSTVPSIYSMETRIIQQRDRCLQIIIKESEGLCLPQVCNFCIP